MAVAEAKFIRTRAPKRERILQAIARGPDAVDAELCRRTFYYFQQFFWDEVSQDAPQWNWHIELLTEELSKLARDVAKGIPREYDLLINIPPGTTKSITASVMFPAWCWTNWPWMRFIVLSYSASLSLSHAEASRDLIRSEKFGRLFPELSIKRDQDMKSNFRLQETVINVRGQEETKLRGNRYSTSVGGTLTGFHAHVLIVDDPLDPGKAISDVERNSANAWLDQTLPTRKVDKALTPTVMIMQRLHQDDPTGHLLTKKKDKVKLISLPGEIEHFEGNVHPKELISKYKDNLLDPVRMSWPILKDLEADLGQYGYAGQIGQQPTPPGGGMFEVEHFQIIDAMPNDVQVVKIVRYWDKAGTDKANAKKRTSWTVGVKMAYIRSGKYIVMDVKRGLWATEKRENIIRQTAEADGQAIPIYMEQEPGSGGLDSIRASITGLTGFTAFKDRPTGDKIYRADPFSVQVNNGNVLLLQGEWNHLYTEEHRFFPFGTYNDQVDGSSGAFNKLRQKKIAGVVRSGR